MNSIFAKLKHENNYKNLFIIDQIDDVLHKKFNFINFGSSIQYFNNYELILNKASRIGENIFFSGTTLFETKNERYNKHIIVKQVNVYPNINYLYFFNKQYFFSLFLNNNFKLLFEKKIVLITSSMVILIKFLKISIIWIFYLKKIRVTLNNLKDFIG